MQVLFAVNRNQTFTEKKLPGKLRVVDWNIRSFEGLSTQKDKKRLDRMSVAELINAQNADIICLQEFNHSNIQDNLGLFSRKKKLGLQGRQHHFFKVPDNRFH